MANVPSIAKKVQVEEADFLAPTSESLTQKMGGSINWLLDNGQGLAVGSVEGSVLTEAQYQAINGVGFILADGRSVVGSRYNLITTQTNVPDLRGKYLRMKDHGAGLNPDGDTALGTVQAGANKSHIHPVTYQNPSFPFIDQIGLVNTNLIADSGPNEGIDPAAPPTITFAMSPQGSGTGEGTHVKLNWFIRID